MTFHRIFNKSPMTSATSVAETVNLSGGKPQILVGIALLIFFSNNIYLFTCIVSCCDVRYVFAYNDIQVRLYTRLLLGV